MPKGMTYLYLELVCFELPHLACVIEGDGVIVPLPAKDGMQVSASDCKLSGGCSSKQTGSTGPSKAS